MPRSGEQKRAHTEATLKAMDNQLASWQHEIPRMRGQLAEILEMVKKREPEPGEQPELEGA